MRRVLLRSVVVYRGKIGERVINALDEYFPLEPVEIRGLGMAYRYETERTAAYIIRLNASYEANVRLYEERIIDALGHVDEVISLNPHVADPREGLFVHSAGNVAGEGYGKLHPLSLAPTSPSFIGTFVLAAQWVSSELGEAPVHIEATHDLPVDSKIPYVSVEYRGDYADELALALGATLGRRGKFRPYLTIGMSYYADEFVPLIRRKRIVPAYHVPVYLAHNITAELIRRLKEKKWIVGILTGEGVPEDVITTEVFEG